jgi:hypothetical protein
VVATAVLRPDQGRSSHLPQLFKELIHRLRYPRPLGAKGQPSKSAHEHGLTRRKPGYSAAMLVEESRMLEVSIFDSLHKMINGWTSAFFSLMGR